MGKTSSVIGSFLVGGLIGAAAGLLFAPRSGRETREYLADKAVEYWDRADEMYEVGREKALDAYEVGRERALEAYEVGREKAVVTSDQVRHKIDAARERLIDALADEGELADEQEGEPMAAEPVAAEPATESAAAPSGAVPAGA